MSWTAPAGSVGQVREAALRLMEFAKGDGIAVVLVGHVTKDGSIAGPKTLEHLVDAVVDLEGERYAALRLLRASKNRFGSTEEVGVFEMGEVGLMRSPIRRGRSSATTTPARRAASSPRPSKGSRPLLVEVQALVAPGRYGAPGDGERPRSESPRAADRGARPTRRGRAWAPTTSMRTSPAG